MSGWSGNRGKEDPWEYGGRCPGDAYGVEPAADVEFVSGTDAGLTLAAKRAEEDGDVIDGGRGVVVGLFGVWFFAAIFFLRDAGRVGWTKKSQRNMTVVENGTPSFFLNKKNSGDFFNA
jgi:hypothetical protein